MIDDRRPTALAIPSHGNSKMADTRQVAQPRARSPHLRLVRSARLPIMPKSDADKLARTELSLVSARPRHPEPTSYAARLMSAVRRWLELVRAD